MMQPLHDDQKAPLLKSWSRWYALVIVWLAILVVLFYFFTKMFA